MDSPVLLNMTAPLRDDFDIPYHDLGPRDETPTVALVAGLHGNELNGVFVLSRLANLLHEVWNRERSDYSLKKRVVIIPAVNVLGVNVRSRPWPFDKTDINRMFPGYDQGETTQRIAYAIITVTMNAAYRVDLHSSNPDFEEVPQVRLYAPNADERASAFLFGLPAVVERPMDQVFTSTIGHAWRWYGGENFVIQAGKAGDLQLQHCERVFHGLLRFLRGTGVLQGPSPDGEEDTHLFGLDQTFPIISERAGLFVSHMPVGRWVQAGEVLGELYDAFGGVVLENIKAPVSGLLSGLRRQPLLVEGDLVARVQTRESLPEDLGSFFYGQ
jgi:predicted deacylase